jgi:hypothetical protein
MTDQYIACSKTVAARELAGETIIMSTVDSTLFCLNETATCIWRAADGRTPLSEIVERHVCQEFEVSPEQAYRDAIELVEDLAGRGIMILSNQPIEDTSQKAMNSRLA